MSYNRSNLLIGGEGMRRQRVSRSVWSARSLLPLSNVRPGPIAAASCAHSKRCRAVRVRLCRAVLLAGFYALVASCGSSAQAAPLPADWQHEQHFEVSAPGLLKLSLPLSTLDAARPLLDRKSTRLNSS